MVGRNVFKSLVCFACDQKANKVLKNWLSDQGINGWSLFGPFDRIIIVFLALLVFDFAESFCRLPKVPFRCVQFTKLLEWRMEISTIFPIGFSISGLNSWGIEVPLMMIYICFELWIGCLIMPVKSSVFFGGTQWISISISPMITDTLNGFLIETHWKAS